LEASRTAVTTEDLTRDYSGGGGLSLRKVKQSKVVRALDHVSFRIGDGELFGLLGPNGAGKTTTIKVLSTLLEPTSGKAFVKGYDVQKEPNKIRRLVNMVAGGERMLYMRLTARENLEYFAELYNVPRNEVPSRITNLLEIVGLSDRADDEVEKYSKGMKQRLQICRGLINDPEVLFLDEPTLGLDIDIAKDIRSLIRNKVVKEQGKTVLLTTHYMYEAEEMCERAAFLNKGKVVALGRIEELKQGLKVGTSVELTVANLSGDVVEGMKQLPAIKNVTVADLGKAQDLPLSRLVVSSDSDRVVPTVLGYLSGRDCKVVSINVKGPTLEDLFMDLVGDRK
jgi:ABC-2 type transport system ATP-binding protein